jgi:hypothetical protein
MFSQRSEKMWRTEFCRLFERRKLSEPLQVTRSMAESFNVMLFWESLKPAHSLNSDIYLLRESNGWYGIYPSAKAKNLHSVYKY